MNLGNRIYDNLLAARTKRDENDDWEAFEGKQDALDEADHASFDFALAMAMIQGPQNRRTILGRT